MELKTLVDGNCYELAKEWFKENATQELAEASEALKAAQKVFNQHAEALEAKAFALRDKWKEEKDEIDEDNGDDEDTIDEAVSEFMAEICCSIYPFSSNLVYHHYDNYCSHWDVDGFWEPSTC